VTKAQRTDDVLMKIKNYRRRNKQQRTSEEDEMTSLTGNRFIDNKQQKVQARS
jgi:hypothetical protein